MDCEERLPLLRASCNNQFMADATWKEKYAEERVLTQGGQGQIVLVRRKADGQLLCLKRLLNVSNASRVARFKREVGVSQRLSHPSLLPVLDASLDDPRPWYVSPYLPGGTLTGRGGGSIEDAFAIFEMVVSGVAILHENRIVHRDIKPDNVFLDEAGNCVVGDLGLAFVLGDDPEFRLTETGEAVGPRYYMAPELEDGASDAVTCAADVYSLGKLLYFLCAGRIFSRERHRESSFNLLASDNTSAVHFVYEVLDRTVLNAPAARIQNASHLLALVRVQRRRLSRGSKTLDLSANLDCNFCGIGRYRVVADTRAGLGGDAVHNFGFRPAGAPVSIVLCCNVCGNAQYFRLDLAEKTDYGWRSLPDRVSPTSSRPATSGAEDPSTPEWNERARQRIAAWVSALDSTRSDVEIDYSEVDNALRFPPGTAKRLIPRTVPKTLLTSTGWLLHDTGAETFSVRFKLPTLP